MNIIKLTLVGNLDSEWFWNCAEIQEHNPFHNFLSFKPFEIINHIEVNADMIEELKEGIPTIHIRSKEYKKRNKFVELIFGKKYVYDYKEVLFKDKVTWVKFNSGVSYYVAESIDQIKKLSN